MLRMNLDTGLSVKEKTARRFKYSVNGRLSKAITSVSTAEPFVALTFDDGPSAATRSLLDILETHNAKATFFMVGKAANESPDIVQEVLHRGHTVGNHTWSHQRMTKIGICQQLHQIQAAKSVLPDTLLYRPPYGAQNATTSLVCKYLGLTPVTWSRESKDWLGYSAKTIFELTSKDLNGGEIILFHDHLQTYSKDRQVDRGPTLEAVDKLLEVKSRSLEFVTLQHLLVSGTANWERWYHE